MLPMTFCIILGTLLGIVSLLLGARWCRRAACRGRWWARPVRVARALGMGRDALGDPGPLQAFSVLVPALHAQSPPDSRLVGDRGPWALLCF